MKKLLHLFICLLLVACDDYDIDSSFIEPIPEDKSDSHPENYPSGYTISLGEAVSIANEIADINSESTSRAPTRVANINDIDVIAEPNSRKGANDTLIYIINYEDKRGFAAISAVKSELPVIAVIDDGDYQGVKNSDNPGFNMFMDMATEYVIKKRESYENSGSRGDIGPFEPTPRDEFLVESDTIYRSVLSPKLGNRNWGQEGVEGSLCPNGKAGCGPLAIAMILSYYQQPAWVEYTYPGADIDSENIDWGNNNKHKPDAYSSNCFECTSATHNTIARIMREIGHRTNAKYEGDNGTSTKSDDVKKILKGYLPMKTVSGYYEYNKTGVKDAITKGLVLIGGERGTYSFQDFKGDGIKHAWVADGYYFLTRILRYFERKYGELEWKYIRQETVSDEMIHFNWGWNGLANGYFSSEVFCAIRELTDPLGVTSTTREYYSNAQYVSVE